MSVDNVPLMSDPSTLTLTPDKIEELIRRSQTEKASVVITESEWALLETLSFIERLKEQPRPVAYRR